MTKTDFDKILEEHTLDNPEPGNDNAGGCRCGVGCWNHRWHVAGELEAAVSHLTEPPC